MSFFRQQVSDLTPFFLRLYSEGPVGGIIAGVAISALTGKAIDSAEEHANKKAQQKLEAGRTCQQDEANSAEDPE